MPGMHNIQPAGQTWPAEDFYLARKAHDFILSACFLKKNTLRVGKNISISALGYEKNNLGARLRFEMCTLALCCVAKSRVNQLRAKAACKMFAKLTRGV